MWYQILMGVGVGMSGILIAVLLGGWLVFKAKTITMPSPFLQFPQKQEKTGGSYVSHLYRDDTSIIEDDELSSPAARLRAQKLDTNDMDFNMRIIKGKK
jgi:hypothetical protein